MGNYELMRMIGQTDSADLWLARSHRPGLWIVKRPYVHLQDVRWIEGFLDESRIVHPNLVEVIESSESPQPHVVTEYVHGVSLREVMSKGALPRSIAAEIFVSVVRGLAFACSRREPVAYIHAHIEPDHVRIGFDGSVKLSELGPVV